MSGWPVQVTAHQLQINREAELKEEERLARERADAAKRMVRMFGMMCSAGMSWWGIGCLPFAGIWGRRG